MTTPTDPDRDMEMLKEAFDRYAPMPDGLVDMLMTGYQITTIDARIARLVEDSLADGVAAVRAEDAGVRFVAFEDETVSIELEIDDSPMLVTGHIDARATGSLHLETTDGTTRIEIGDDGGFSFTLRNRSPFRLRYDDGAGVPIVTEWMTP